jgi:predicted ATPase/DNA-binding response OmpR family regulator/class 3 adenylate cyclase
MRVIPHVLKVVSAATVRGLGVRECVLVVAQEMDLRARIARGLQSSGYAVELATDECRALRLASGQGINAAIVAPDSSLAGLAMARKLRDSVPKLLVLAERSEDMARLSRSLPEADAFLLKSSIEEELVCRLAELIIPTKAGGDTAAPVPTSLWMEDCKLDLAARLFIDADGRELLLTRAECALLRELANNPGQIRSRDDLRHAVAGRGADPCERSIDMLVARLRQKIEPDSKNPRFIVTIPGAGYKLVASRQNGNGQHSGAKASEPERRQLTILSCNIAGSAALAAKFDPEDLASTMRDFQDCCRAVVTRVGGTVSTRSTNEMLALFGYPEAHEDDAERAVHAGLDLVEKIGQLQSPAGEPLQVRIGLATGLALVGPEEAVVGEPVVVAAGLRNLASSNSVLIAESTRKLLSRVLVCDDLARHQLTGASGAVNACRVTGRRTVESRFKATRPQGVMRLVGREQELGQLLALWDRAKHGEGQVALVCGEAGIGKSHLCEFFLEHVVEESHATLRYQCSPHHPNSPFYPVISQLEQAMGFEQADTPELKFDKLKAALSHTFEPTRETILLYAALLSITPQREQSLSLTPQRQKDLIIATLIRHVLSHADKQPLVIVLADAHWIDSSTLELVNRIIPLIKKARVLLLIKFRPDFKPKWLCEPHVTMLPLDRMGHEHSHAIISDVIGDKELPREVEEEIIHKADGIPLFIEELTKSVMQSGWVQDVDNRCVVPGLLPTAVPASLLDSLTARLDRLGPAKEIAQIGAVIGREFSQSLLAAVAPDSSNSLKSALAQLKVSELVLISCQGANTVYEFKHALLQEAAYATLPRAKRQQFHSRVAYALQNSFPLTIETQPELLAYHFGQAGFTERAVDYLVRAGRRSIEQSANVEAIGHLTRGLELLRGLPDTPERKRATFLVEVMLGQAMIAAYGYAAPKTRETLLRARTLIDDSTDLAQKFAVLYGGWASHYVAGETAKQRPLAVEFLAEAERTSNTALQCIAHRIVGTTDLTVGEFATALNHLKRTRALYDSEHHASYRHQYGQDIGASALCYLSWTLWHLGYIDQASEAAAEAMKLAEKLSHPHTLVYTICHARGFMDLFRRRHEDIQSYAGLVISICKENGFSHWMNCGKIFHGWADVCRGQVDTGMEVLREGMVGWQKSGAGLWMPTFLMLEAEAYRQSGRDEAALQALERALAICEDSGERWAIAEVLRCKAHLLLSARRADDAEIESILLKSLEIARCQQARCWELRTSYDLSRLWQRRGQSKKALKLLQSVYDQFTEGFDTADLRDAQKLLRTSGRKLRLAAQGVEGGANTLHAENGAVR